MRAWNQNVVIAAVNARPGSSMRLEAEYLAAWEGEGE